MKNPGFSPDFSFNSTGLLKKQMNKIKIRQFLNLNQKNIYLYIILYT